MTQAPCGNTVAVCVRLRPLTSNESSSPDEWVVEGNSLHVIPQHNKAVVQSFPFDHVFDRTVDTPHVYTALGRPIVLSAADGYNGCIFAYGQTSSGKTHTMYGSAGRDGIIPLGLSDLFQRSKSDTGFTYGISVSYFEIYNEEIRDLLGNRRRVSPRTDFAGRVQLDLQTVDVLTVDDAIKVLGDVGSQRTIGTTMMNEHSSRSHTVFRVTIHRTPRVGHNTEGCSATCSELNFVDLAGSENAKAAGTAGQVLREGRNINKSLLALSTVIEKLSEAAYATGSGHINYRDSVLTRILSNSLGGNSKTAIVCTVTPAAAQYQQTLSTLQFASRAKRIEYHAKVNDIPGPKDELTRLRRRVRELEESVVEGNDKAVHAALLQSKDEYIASLEEDVAHWRAQATAAQRQLDRRNQHVQHLEDRVRRTEALSSQHRAMLQSALHLNERQEYDLRWLRTELDTDTCRSCRRRSSSTDLAEEYSRPEDVGNQHFLPEWPPASSSSSSPHLECPTSSLSSPCPDGEVNQLKGELRRRCFEERQLQETINHLAAAEEVHERQRRAAEVQVQKLREELAAKCLEEIDLKTAIMEMTDGHWPKRRKYDDEPRHQGS